MRYYEYAWEMFGSQEFRKKAQESVVELVRDFVYSYELEPNQCLELYDEIHALLDEFYEKMLIENLRV